MSRTTFLTAVLLTGALLAVAVDVADGVERPAQRILEGAVLSAIVLGLWLRSGRERLARGFGDDGPIGRPEAIWTVVVATIAVVGAQISDGLGLHVAVLMLTVAAITTRESRSV